MCTPVSIFVKQGNQSSSLNSLLLATNMRVKQAIVLQIRLLKYELGTGVTRLHASMYILKHMMYI
jgi:hypothetical protein